MSGIRFRRSDVDGSWLWTSYSEVFRVENWARLERDPSSTGGWFWELHIAPDVVAHGKRPSFEAAKLVVRHNIAAVRQGAALLGAKKEG